MGVSCIVGFVLCIGALYTMPRGWSDGAALPGVVADVK